MVLAACKHVGGNVDRQEIDRDLALRGLSGDAQVVFEISVAHVPAIHRPGQIGAVGVPVKDIECVRLAPFEIVAYDVGPDQVVTAQRRKDEGELLTRHDAAMSDRLLTRRHARSSISRPISPASLKSSIVVSNVRLAILSSPRAASTAAAQPSIVPPTQKPRALALSAPVIRRARHRSRA